MYNLSILYRNGVSKGKQSRYWQGEMTLGSECSAGDLCKVPKRFKTKEKFAVMKA